MSPEIHAAFEAICRTEVITGPVLEIGALPGPDCLLKLPSLAHLTDKTALDLQARPAEDGITWVAGNANRMDMFADGHFGCVLCNSVLEHDARFWETLAEIRRVTAHGGLIVLGVPGFRGMGPGRLAPHGSLLGRALKFLARKPGYEFLGAGTLALGEHHYPSDYYRFTVQAVREVFLQDLVDIQTREVMLPPRILGWGRKP